KDAHRDGAAGLPRREAERAAGGGVVLTGRGRAVGGRVVDRYGQAAGLEQAHYERGAGRAAVAFGHRHVVDRQPGRGVVVENGADPCPGPNRIATGWIAQVDNEGLVGLVERIADDRYSYRLACLTTRESHRPAGGLVVSARRCRARRRAGGKIYCYLPVVYRR